jgi:hypothetical protein
VTDALPEAPRVCIRPVTGTEPRSGNATGDHAAKEERVRPFYPALLVAERRAR